MFRFLFISRYTRSTFVNVIHKGRNSTQVNIENEMKIFNDKKEFAKVIALFDDHKHQQMPTDRAIVQALKACTHLGDVNYDISIHNELSNDSLKNIYIRTALIHFYMQCGRMNDAERIFESSTHKTAPDYRSMMKGYLVNNMPEKAMEFFLKVSKPDKVILRLLFNSCSQVATKEALNLGRKVWSEMPLVNRENEYMLSAAFNMFITCGDLSSAEHLFMTMKPNVIEYGQLMKCYNNHNMPMKTINLYEKMKNEGLQADLVTFILLAYACAQIGIKSRCRSIVSQIPPVLLANIKLQTSLIHMWGKAGSVIEAKRIFEQIDHRDHVTYNAMINKIQITKNLRICGDCHAAIKLISHIRQCQITIRDNNRVHHFLDGQCSYLDHF